MAKQTQLLVLVLVDASRLAAVLNAWQEAGIPAATVLPSLGMRRAHGPLSALWPLEQAAQRTLMAVVDDEEIVKRATRATVDIVGDFANPNTGILFAMPVHSALGLEKRPPPKRKAEPEEQEPEEVIEPRPEERALNSDTPVEQVVKMLQIPPTVVREDEPIQQVAMKMCAASNVRTLCVVDDQGRLVGLIPGHELGEDIFFHIMPEDFLREVVELEDVQAFVDRARARLARDAMRPPAWVRPDHTVRDAFRRMHEAGVDGLPVVDEELRITGYVNLAELLQLWLAVGAGQ